MPELVTSSFSARAGIADEHDINVSIKHEIGTATNSTIALPIEYGVAITSDIKVVYDRNTAVDSGANLVIAATNKPTDCVNSLNYTNQLPSVDLHFNTIKPNDLLPTDSVTSFNYINMLPSVDLMWREKYHSVHRFNNKPRKPDDYRYTPTSNFTITGELIGFTSNFNNPLDYDKLKTPLSPLECATNAPWNGVGELIRLNKRLGYGYSINKFLVGGGSRVIYPVDEDALVPPEPNEPIKVIRIVNNVSIVTLPARTPLNFDSIKLARQIDSFAWTADITLLDQTSFDLVKPTASATTEIEVSINGTVWNMFVSRGSKSQQFGSESFSVKAFSKSALLQEIYTGKISFTNSSNTTPATLINDIITSYGFTSVWNLIPSWTISQYQFSVQNKSPIEAVSAIADSIGAVIEPNLLTNTITIKPWCETSPWQWNTLTNLPNIDANLSYEVSEDYSPQAQANAIYVTGQDGNGVAAKCVISNTAGDVLLPSVSDKLITDTIAAQERGRIELAKSGHKENVPLTTFIDEAETLLMPGDMITVNNVAASAWNGMVTETSITVANEGLEVYQTLSVLRHYN